MKDLIQIKDLPVPVLKRLLSDKTTGKNIIWATDSYSDQGSEYERDQQIQYRHVIKHGFLQPRIQKALEVQKERTKKNAEVFTPAWICNSMINSLDQEWFGHPDVFNKQEDNAWKTNAELVPFSGNDQWKDYVRQRVLEITCGEAPFLVSRYDSSTGETIEVENRIGMLDRKLRIVTENTDTVEDWYKWAIKALQNTYGYEFQGDSLLIGRVNIYLTMAETMKAVWNQTPNEKQQMEIANIICWNLWQMDGLTDCIPVGVPEEQFVQTSLFDFIDCGEEEKGQTAVMTKTYDWKNKNKSFVFKEMKEGKDMAKHFDVIIGNPPYQENDGGAQSSAKPVYNLFVENAMKLNPHLIEMIIPTRWYAGGKGLDEFRKKMLSETHLQYLYDFINPNEVFQNTNIRGGVCYFILNSKGSSLANG